MNTAAIRIPALDALRGFALFGILIVNAPFFLMPEGNFGTYAATTFPGWHNRAAEFLVAWLFEGKFILIFSFLFGWGLNTQMSRGVNFSSRYFRRLAGLFAIGLAHAVFLFVGDILVTYALLGIPLYLMRNWQVKKLVTAAIVLWGLSIVAQAALGALVSTLPPTSFAEYEALVELHQSGSFAAILGQRIYELGGLYVITPLLFMPEVMSMFLLGLAAAKTYGQTGIAPAKPGAKSLMKWLWLPALAANGLYAAVTVFPGALALGETVTLGVRAAAVPLLTAVYLAGSCLILDHARGERIARFLGGEGRMSLSIYVGESLVMSTIALSYGLALFGRVSSVEMLVLCVAVYLALLLSADFWSSIFKIGPLEWVLRKITGP